MEREDMKDFSLVVPVFNSEKSLTELFERLKSVFNSMNKTFEFSGQVCFLHNVP